MSFKHLVNCFLQINHFLGEFSKKYNNLGCPWDFELIRPEWARWAIAVARLRRLSVRRPSVLRLSSVHNFKMLLLCHFVPDFNSVCFIWYTRWGIRNFYTEFWNSLNMLILGAFFKNHKKMLLLPHLLTDFNFFFHLKDFHVVHWTSTRNFEILFGTH